MANPKLYIVVNEDRFFLSHRKPVALAARENGFDPVIVTKDTGKAQEIRNLNLPLIELPINPTGMNPMQEAKTFFFLWNLYGKDNPDIVHHVGLKNILWGGLAAKFRKVPGVVNAVCGLGSLFNGNKLSYAKRVILSLLKYANKRKNVRFIFQNDEDRDLFLEHNVTIMENTDFTKGSGVDLEEFAYSQPANSGIINIIFTARLVKEKGITDLIDAAEILRKDYQGKIRFLICGRLTPNRSGITKEYLNHHCDGEYIQWLGEREDIVKLLSESHIMAFPSYYREGVPRSLIEASAVGLPIVTCDSVGCKDVVTDGVNGFLIEPRNPRQLAERLETLINDPELRLKMGKESRKFAEKNFPIQDVVNTHIKVYKELMYKTKG